MLPLPSPADVVKETGFDPWLGSAWTSHPSGCSLPQPVAKHLFRSPPTLAGRRYRLLDGRGLPHPELDELFESLDAALEAAVAWIEHQQLLEAGSGPLERSAALGLHFGLEVSTPSGDWRTLRHAGASA